MKKYILSLLVVGLSIVGFSNAGSLSFQNQSISELGSYLIPLTNSDNGTVNFNFTSVPSRVFLEVVCCDNLDDVVSDNTEVLDNPGSADVVISNSISYSCDYCGKVYSMDGGEYSFTVSSDLILSNSGGGGISAGTLLPGGQEALSGAVSGLTSTVNEFIPLMVYIGLGVLGAVIGFFAIKWLISYVSGKTFSIFKK